MGRALSREWGKRLGLVLFAAASVGLVRNTAFNGQDFEVFWRAAAHAWAGQPPYSLVRDGGMVFKYPPWTLPFFYPWAWLPLQTAKWVFGVFEVASLFSVLLWLRRRLGASQRVVALAALAFWGLWMVHTLDGQVVLPMLACALWLWKPAVMEENPWRAAGLCLGLSTKIFSLLPLFPDVFRWKALRSWVLAALAAAALSWPVMQAQQVSGPLGLLQAWKEAAASGATHLDSGQTRGRANAGLVGWVLREAEVPAQATGTEVTLALVLSLGLGGLWAWRSRQLAEVTRWVGWLALVPVVHPLPWWHLFIFAFPAAVLAMERSRQRGTAWTLATAFAWFLLCAGTEKLLGPAGIFLELHASKSWGALLCLGILERVES